MLKFVIEPNDIFIYFFHMFSYFFVFVDKCILYFYLFFLYFFLFFCEKYGRHIYKISCYTLHKNFCVVLSVSLFSCYTFSSNFDKKNEK